MPMNRRGGKSSASFPRSKKSSQRKPKAQLQPKNFVHRDVKPPELSTHTSAYSYQDLDLHPNLQRNISAKGYTDPTPIQEQAIPPILKGEDLLGIAQTGSGKTAAFLIPLINKLANNRDEQVLILAPTRELAEQINEEFRALGKKLGLFSALCVGGQSMRKQIEILEKGSRMVIGTPGRIMDLTDKGKLDLSHMSTIVLDEVDRMLDMGFIEDIRRLIREFPEERHSLFFSATLDPKIQNLMREFLRQSYQEVKLQASPSSEHIYQDVVLYSHPEEKKRKLKELLEDYQDDGKVLVFANTKKGVDFLERTFQDMNFAAIGIHGDKEQPERKRTLKQFKSGEVNILIATDVAARGLDISNVSLVVNYDAPENYDDYIHRIGRTGRAGAIGQARTFVEE
ncbi:MAG: ATP-dependent helicase [Parcubacteria group bacterium SW_4_49_11]|nr:MAG: ATP-dependent helicase [Parcubacteria group bacterium SW_4_49_11]